MQGGIEDNNGVFGHGEVIRDARAVAIVIYGGEERPAPSEGDSTGRLEPVRVCFVGCYMAKSREAVDKPLLFIFC